MNDWMILNNELQRMWKEADLNYVSETRKNLNKDFQRASQG
jgi:hypothetical protein